MNIPAGSKADKGAAEKMMRLATVFSLCAGIFLVVIKALAWSVTDSLSLMSSLADSMLDVIASLVNFAAVRYALQPADDEHRFGHGKAEDLATLAQSTFITGSGVFLIIVGLKRVFSPEPVNHGALGVSVMIVSICITLALVLYQRKVVKYSGSTAVAADSVHYFADLLTNSAVIAALILSQLFGWYAADALFAILIAGYLIFTSAVMGYSAFHNLMDHEFLPEDREKIIRIVRSTPSVIGLHELRTRKSGLTMFIQLHLDLHPDMTLRVAHSISDQVEASLAAEFPNAEIFIHQDPLHEGHEIHVSG